MIARRGPKYISFKGECARGSECPYWCVPFTFFPRVIEVADGKLNVKSLWITALQIRIRRTGTMAQMVPPRTRYSRTT